MNWDEEQQVASINGFDEPIMCSKPSESQITVSFQNETQEGCVLYWVDFEGKFVKCAVVGGGGSDIVTMNTFTDQTLVFSTCGDSNDLTQIFRDMKGR